MNILFKNFILFSSLAVIILTFAKCSKSDRSIDTQILNCDIIEDIISIFEDLSSDNDYIINFTTASNHYEFDFKIRENIKLSKECILDIQAIEDKSTIIIAFSNSRKLIMDYRNKVSLSYIHNPSGFTPLSGLLKINADFPGKINFSIKNIKEGLPKYFFEFQKETKVNQLPILGMYYNMKNEIYVEFYSDDQIYYRDTVSVNIGPKPNYLPTINVDVHNPILAEPGMNLVSSRLREPSTPFIVDNEGEYRYVLDFSGHEELSNLNYDVGMERLTNGNYYFGKLLSNQLYEIDVLGNILHQWNLGEFEFHHNVQEKQDGNLLVTVSKYDAHISGRRAIEDWIIEIDRSTGGIVNSWNLKESLDQTRRLYGWWEWSDIVDWAHVNAVIHDASDNTIIVSCRTQCVVKLDYNNNVKWILDCHKDWKKNARGNELSDYLLTPLDANGNSIVDNSVLQGESQHPDFDWPWYQHAPFLSKEGNLFMFDNGENRNFSSNTQYSRAVEYKIDEENMTIQQVWQYGRERGTECYSRIASDVDQLSETSNIYFCPGSRVNNGSGNIGGKIIEIDYQTKEVVLEIRINAPDIVFHRAEKLSLYPHYY